MFDCVDTPEVVNPIPTKFVHKWKYNLDGIPIRPKNRVVVQGFYEDDTGADKAATVASMESVDLLIAIAAQHGLILKQAGITTTLLYARTPADAAPVYVIHPKGSSVRRNDLDRSGSSRRGFTVCVSPRRDRMADFLCIC